MTKKTTALKTNGSKQSYPRTLCIISEKTDSEAMNVSDLVHDTAPPCGPLSLVAQGVPILDLAYGTAPTPMVLYCFSVAELALFGLARDTEDSTFNANS